MRFGYNSGPNPVHLIPSGQVKYMNCFMYVSFDFDQMCILISPVIVSRAALVNFMDSIL